MAKPKSKSSKKHMMKHKAPNRSGGAKRSPMVPVAAHTRGSGSDPRGRFAGGESNVKVAGHLRSAPGMDAGYGGHKPPMGPSRG